MINFKLKAIRKQVGSSLIEVMIALFILAVGLLGVLSMQVKSMQFNQSAYYYTQAVYLANEILDSMRSNKTVLDAYSVALATDVDEPDLDCRDVTVACTPSELKDINLYEWRSNVASTLVSGKSSIVSSNGSVVITVQFDDSRSDAVNATSPTTAEYILVTEIN